MLKRLFVMDGVGEKLVLFADESGKAVYISESAFNEPLTLELAKNADYSNFENCETAEEASANYADGTHLIDYNADDWDSIAEF